MSTWDDKPNDYEHALAQIQRLLAEREQNVLGLIEYEKKTIELMAKIKRIHNETIEKCAQVVLKYDGPYEIVQAIRELSDKQEDS